MTPRFSWRAQTAGTSAGAREAFLILCVQVGALHIGQSLVVPILPLYAQTFGVSVALVGLLLSFQSLPRMFANLPAGRWADRIGAHRLLVIACGVVTVSALGAAAAPNYEILLASRVLQGIGTAISATAGLTYTANISSSETRARHISLYQGSFLTGNGLGPIIGGFTAQFLGFRAPFLAYALIAVLVGIWIALRLPDPRQWSAETESADEAETEGGPGENTRTGNSPGGNDETGETQPRDSQPRLKVRQLLLMGGVLFACLIGLAAAFTRAATRNFGMVLVAESIGMTEGQIGVALSVIFAVNVAVLYFAGWLGDRYRTRLLVMAAWAVAGVALVGMSTVSEFGWLLVAASAYGMAAGIESPVPAVHITRTVGENTQGVALGLYRTFNDLGLVTGPILMGWIARAADPSVGVRLNGMVYLGAVVALGLFVAGQRIRARRPTDP